MVKTIQNLPFVIRFCSKHTMLDNSQYKYLFLNNYCSGPGLKQNPQFILNAKLLISYGVFKIRWGFILLTLSFMNVTAGIFTGNFISMFSFSLGAHHIELHNLTLCSNAHTCILLLFQVGTTADIVLCTVLCTVCNIQLPT